MPNNITPLEDELKARAKENAALAAENFSQDGLTDEEREKVAAMEAESHTVVVSTDAEGHRTETSIEDYADGVGGKVIQLPGTDTAVKAVNTGDIVQTVEDMKAEARAKAIKIFRDLSVTDAELSDDVIVAINDEALAAVQKKLGIEKMDADAITRKLKCMSISDMVTFLPEKFVQTYATENEIKVSNYKAKERLISTIAYLTTTGPEMDYLNDYIDHEHRMMEVSRKIMDLNVKLSDAIAKEEKFSEIISKAAEIAPADTSVWAKYIKEPNRVHNEFAQRAVVCREYREAYERLLEEYPAIDGDSKEAKLNASARAEIQAQIDECAAKYQAYIDVVDFKLLHELWEVMTTRFMADRKNGYKNMTREAVSALDRIRRAKQNVPFPVYDKRYAGKPELLYQLYITAYPKMLENYNKTLHGIHEKDKTADLAAIPPIEIDGVDTVLVHEYFSMILLILFGRVMKRLGNKGLTKYDAIMLDCYFNCYCRLGTDIYMMTDIWNMCKDFVEHCCKTYVKPKK